MNTGSSSLPEDDCHQTASPAATSIGGNDDLLTEILVCTPVKSLIRFTSVSKHWFSLISASPFHLLHTLQHPNIRPSGLFLRKTPSPLYASKSEFEFISFSNDTLSGVPFTSLNFLNDPSGIRILQSCNGLLFCGTSQKSLGKTTHEYHIYNPTTKKHLTLPPLSEAQNSVCFGAGLAFNPSKSIHYTVVCFHSVSNHINYHCRTLYKYHIHIYSSDTRSWRSYGDPLEASCYMWRTNGVFWNGSIHWISPYMDSFRFDVDNDCLGTMPAIPVLTGGEHRRYRYFGESNDHLHLVVYGTRTVQFDVFEMKRDYSEWFAKYRVDLVGIINSFPEMDISHLGYSSVNYDYTVLGVVREDDTNEDESLLLLQVPGKVLSYKFKKHTFKEIHNLAPEKFPEKGSLRRECFEAYIFAETLALV